MNQSHRMIKVGGICGLLGIVIYTGLALSDPYIGGALLIN